MDYEQQLEALKGVSAELAHFLNHAQGRAADLRGELNIANAKISELQKEIAALKSELKPKET